MPPVAAVYQTSSSSPDRGDGTSEEESGGERGIMKAAAGGVSQSRVGKVVASGGSGGAGAAGSSSSRFRPRPQLMTPEASCAALTAASTAASTVTGASGSASSAAATTTANARDDAEAAPSSSVTRFARGGRSSRRGLGLVDSRNTVSVRSDLTESLSSRAGAGVGAELMRSNSILSNALAGGCGGVSGDLSSFAGPDDDGDEHEQQEEDDGGGPSSLSSSRQHPRQQLFFAQKQDTAIIGPIEESEPDDEPLLSPPALDRASSSPSPSSSPAPSPSRRDDGARPPLQPSAAAAAAKPSSAESAAMAARVTTQKPPLLLTSPRPKAMTSSSRNRSCPLSNRGGDGDSSSAAAASSLRSCGGGIGGRRQLIHKGRSTRVFRVAPELNDEDEGGGGSSGQMTAAAGQRRRPRGGGSGAASSVVAKPVLLRHAAPPRPGGDGAQSSPGDGPAAVRVGNGDASSASSGGFAVVAVKTLGENPTCDEISRLYNEYHVLTRKLRKVPSVRQAVQKGLDGIGALDGPRDDSDGDAAIVDDDAEGITAGGAGRRGGRAAATSSALSSSQHSTVLEWVEGCTLREWMRSRPMFERYDDDDGEDEGEGEGEGEGKEAKLFAGRTRRRRSSSRRRFSSSNFFTDNERYNVLQTVRTLRDVASALADVNEAGVEHNDVSVDNVIVCAPAVPPPNNDRDRQFEDISAGRAEREEEDDVGGESRGGSEGESEGDALAQARAQAQVQAPEQGVTSVPTTSSSATSSQDRRAPEQRQQPSSGSRPAAADGAGDDDRNNGGRACAASSSSSFFDPPPPRQRVKLIGLGYASVVDTLECNDEGDRVNDDLYSLGVLIQDALSSELVGARKKRSAAEKAKAAKEGGEEGDNHGEEDDDDDEDEGAPVGIPGLEEDYDNGSCGNGASGGPLGGGKSLAADKNMHRMSSGFVDMTQLGFGGSGRDVADFRSKNRQLRRLHPRAPRPLAKVASDLMMIGSNVVPYKTAREVVRDLDEMLNDPDGLLFVVPPTTQGAVQRTLDFDGGEVCGREGQARALAEAYERVAANNGNSSAAAAGEGGNGGSGSVSCRSSSSEAVLLSGRAGAGKAFLADRVLRPISRYYVKGKFDEHRRTEPYSAVLAALSDLCDILASEGEQRGEAEAAKEGDGDGDVDGGGVRMSDVRYRLKENLGRRGAEVLVDALPGLRRVLGEDLFPPRRVPSNAMSAAEESESSISCLDDTARSGASGRSAASSSKIGAGRAGLAGESAAEPSSGGLTRHCSTRAADSAGAGARSCRGRMNAGAALVLPSASKSCHSRIGSCHSGSDGRINMDATSAAPPGGGNTKRRSSVLGLEVNFDEAVRRLLRALSGATPRGIVLFLEDLQWADVPSLRLINSILTDAAAAASDGNAAASAAADCRLLFVGSYCSDEVDANHPLHRCFDDARSRGVPVVSLEVPPMDRAAVRSFTSGALRMTTRLVSSLSDQVHRRSQGNPLFARHFLESLRADGTLTFDDETCLWTWDEKAVAEVHASDDVVGLLTYKMRRLPQEAREVLQILAFVGTSFEASTVRLLTRERKGGGEGGVDDEDDAPADGGAYEGCNPGQAQAQAQGVPLERGEYDRDDFAKMLRLAVEEGLVDEAAPSEPSSGGGGLGGGSATLRFSATSFPGTMANSYGASSALSLLDPGKSYRFAHDRVRRAAYSLVPSPLRSALHLRIGELIWRNAADSQLFGGGPKLFVCVDQLNRGSDLMGEDWDRRDRLAALNLRAGERALNSSADGAAAHYLRSGVLLLGEDGGWGRRYELALALTSSCAEAERRGGNYENMEDLLGEIFANADCVHDRVGPCCTLVKSLGARDRMGEAVDVGLELLDELGESFPCKGASEAAVALDLARTKLALRGKSDEHILNLPVVEEERIVDAVRVMSAIYLYVSLARTDLLPLVAFRILRLSIKHGASEATAFALAIYGTYHCGSLGDVKEGRRFGRLALRLLERLKATDSLARVHVAYYSGVDHWGRSVRLSVEPLTSAYRIGIGAGDVEYASMALQTACCHSFHGGEPLGPLEERARACARVMGDRKQDQALGVHLPLWQTILNLLGRWDGTVDLTGEAMSEDAALKVALERGNVTELSVIYFFKMMLAYFFGQYELAALMGKKARNLVAPGTFVAARQPMYEALAAFALARSAKRRKVGRRARSNLKKLKKYATCSPRNHLQGLLLLKAEGEALRGRGKPDKALELYDAAIEAAGRNGILQDEALANERAGMFLREHGGEKAAASRYLARAYACYAKWGAHALSDNLRRRISFAMPSVPQ